MTTLDSSAVTERAVVQAYLEDHYARLDRRTYRSQEQGCTFVSASPSQLESGTVRLAFSLIDDLSDDHPCHPCSAGPSCHRWGAREDHCWSLHKAGYRWRSDEPGAELDPVYPSGDRPRKKTTSGGEGS